jgi:SPP1 gp7 family putative phage head morphogenesis protein
MTDADIKAVWPNFDPEDIRRYAPWATTKGEVIRLVYPGQNPSSQDLDIYLQRAIAAGRVARPLPTVETFVPNPPGPGAFIARPRRFPPPVIGPDGFPMIPPIPPEVTVATIQRQFEHINITLGEMLTDQNIDEVIAPMGGKINRFTTKEVGRVLNINLRKENPQIQGAIDQWRDLNVSLIKNGTSDFYNDISRVVEDAHMRGLRVEVLARTIQDRYGVSDSRAALIARDQTLKLNGQITRARQQQAGITHYRWITSKDERVREEHQELEGTIHSWNAPPEPGHPGDDYQCRCTASPVVTGVEDE